MIDLENHIKYKTEDYASQIKLAKLLLLIYQNILYNVQIIWNLMYKCTSEVLKLIIIFYYIRINLYEILIP